MGVCGSVVCGCFRAVVVCAVRVRRAGGCEQEQISEWLNSCRALYALQKRVDDYVQHRRLDIRDSLKAVDRHKRKIRVTVTNTHANQQQVGAHDL